MKLKSTFIKKDHRNRLYNTTLPIIAITGGIATGKSVVSSILKSKQLPVIDADLLVKKIYQKDKTISFIKDQYPEVMNNGEINFVKLRELFFQDEKNKKQIEDYIYKELPSTFSEELKSLPKSEVVFYDIPLLFEKNLQNLFDLTILVYASRATQKDRLIRRDHISEDLAEQIINQQMDIEKKRTLANLIIENENEKDLVRQVDLLISKIFD